MKKLKRNKNVQAPDQRVRGIEDVVQEYLAEIGFTQYARTGETQIYSMPICEAIGNALFIFQDGRKLRIWYGIRKGLRIAARKLHDCTVYNLEETIGLLAERNYI
jgi:hypothetical protein